MPHFLEARDQESDWMSRDDISRRLCETCIEFSGPRMGAYIASSPLAVKDKQVVYQGYRLSPACAVTVLWDGQTVVYDQLKGERLSSIARTTKDRSNSLTYTPGQAVSTDAIDAYELREELTPFFRSSKHLTSLRKELMAAELAIQRRHQRALVIDAMPALR